LGLTFKAIGVLVLTSLDKAVEAALIAASPQRLTDLTTDFEIGFVVRLKVRRSPGRNS